MNLLLNIIGLILAILGGVLLFIMYKYIKEHGNEELKIHKSFIFSRLVFIAMLGIGASILHLIAFFLTM